MMPTMLSRLLEDPGLVNAFGDFFYKQFAETNSKYDLDKAIIAYELAVGLTTSDDTNYGIYIHNAGLALYRQFELSGNLADINKVIFILEGAIAYTSVENVTHAAQLDILGNALYDHFKFTYRRTQGY
jgi:hypothetical protein